MRFFSWFHKKHFQQISKQLSTFRSSVLPLNDIERRLLTDIKEKTLHHNRNNITRTMAYFDMYSSHPELEWALLAHMVSRNAGWNMTDLKGEWLPRLLTKKESEDYFLFMERANWLIFQDAYPQLLLYVYSREKKQSYFHLLPHLNVSRFMEVMWHDFWKNGNQTRISTALIINEQNYIEKRVIEKADYGAPIFSDVKFYLQDLLDLNMIVYPVDNQLYGALVHSFPELSKRIELGKKLYGLLFSKQVLPGVVTWCKQQIHSGSREDFLPEIFCSKNMAGSDEYKPHLRNLQLLPQAKPIYSPRLTDVWNDQVHEPASPGDWFEDEGVAEQLSLGEPKVETIDKEYGELLLKVEKLVMTKQLLS